MLVDVVGFLSLSLRSRSKLTAENLSSLYDVPIARAEFAAGGPFTFAPTYAA